MSARTRCRRQTTDARCGRFVKAFGGFEHRMVGSCAFASGGGQHEQPRQLRSDLPQILEMLLSEQDVGDGFVVNIFPAIGGFHGDLFTQFGTPRRTYLMMNGFGAFPAMSIQTLFVCKYSRIASIPLSRPIPDRL